MVKNGEVSVDYAVLIKNTDKLTAVKDMIKDLFDPYEMSDEGEIINIKLMIPAYVDAEEGSAWDKYGDPGNPPYCDQDYSSLAETIEDQLKQNGVIAKVVDEIPDWDMFNFVA